MRKWCTHKNKSREEIVYMKSKWMSGLLLVAVGFSFTQVMVHAGETANTEGKTFHIAARNQT
ncbi:Secreted inhibitor of the activity of phosphataseRapA [Bacillus subtilis QB928]|nr:Secreted inhibitor of the activity of phosphataseRapA [Bacillus subtilis QB928]